MEMIFSAKTLEEAQNKAYAYFSDADKNTLDIKVLEQPEKRLFGVKGEYKISASCNSVSNAKSESVTAETLVPETAPATTSSAGENPSESDTGDFIKQFLTSVATELGLKDFTVTRNETEESIVYNIVSEKLGVIIGHHGETLEAISYLAVLIGNRAKGNTYSENNKLIFVDCNGYRNKRAAQLEEMAERTAERVRKSGRRVTLEPMNAYERRIIHNKISEIPDMCSTSTGNEPNRKVVVSLTANSGAGANADAGANEQQEIVRVHPPKFDKNYGKYIEVRRGHTDNSTDSDTEDEVAYRTKDFKKKFQKNQNKSQVREYRSYKQSPEFSTSFEREYKNK
jgi:spoIIIJ-associated protein